MNDTNFQLLKVYPRDDAAFATHTADLFARLGGDGRADPIELQQRLREAYPSARVEVQERLGMNGAPLPHWYVYRDGRLIPHVGPKLR